MYLIRIVIDRDLPTVRQALTDCQQMHRFVMSLFGTDRQTAQALYRTNLVDDKLHIYIYSKIPAAKIPPCDIQQRDITSWLNGMDANQVWKFDLIASPTEKVGRKGMKNSQRRILRSPYERRDWMERKSAQFGFEILQIREQERIHAAGKHSPETGGKMYHDAYRYQGTLRITDADAFRKALQSGIGPGKAYGFGLLMVKP